MISEAAMRCLAHLHVGRRPIPAPRPMPGEPFEDVNLESFALLAARGHEIDLLLVDLGFHKGGDALVEAKELASRPDVAERISTAQLHYASETARWIASQTGGRQD